MDLLKPKSLNPGHKHWEKSNRKFDRPKYKKKASPEKDIQDAISKKLIAAGYLVIHFNSGVMHSPASKMPFKAYTIRNLGISAGLSDLGAFKDGKCYFIEVKTPSGRQSDTQRRVMGIMKDKNVPYIIARSENDVEFLVS